jgi:hypothetical protein
MVFLGIQEWVQPEGCNLVEIRRNRLGRVPCLYPTKRKLACEESEWVNIRTLHLRGRPFTL